VVLEERRRREWGWVRGKVEGREVEGGGVAAG